MSGDDFRIDEVRFEIELPGEVRLDLPWEACPLHVSGDPLTGWRLIFFVPLRTADRPDRATHCISAAVVGMPMPELARRRLNVTDALLLSPAGDVPLVVWYSSS